MPKINVKTTEQYERIGCGTIDNTDGKLPSISFQVHWVEDDADGIAQFRSVSRTIMITYDSTSPEHSVLFGALRSLGIAALEARPDDELPIVITD